MQRCLQVAPLPYGHRQLLAPAPVFTPADLHLVLYGYATSNSTTDGDAQLTNITTTTTTATATTTAHSLTTTHSLSGLRINELSYGSSRTPVNRRWQISLLPMPHRVCGELAHKRRRSCMSFNRYRQLANFFFGVCNVVLDSGPLAQRMKT